jgi:hypothetical protein
MTKLTTMMESVGMIVLPFARGGDYAGSEKGCLIQINGLIVEIVGDRWRAENDESENYIYAIAL